MLFSALPLTSTIFHSPLMFVVAPVFCDDLQELNEISAIATKGINSFFIISFFLSLVNTIVFRLYMKCKVRINTAFFDVNKLKT